MSKREKIEAAFNTLLFSWGSDIPNEIIWSANEMMEAITGKENVYTLYETGSEDFQLLSETEQEEMFKNFLSQLDLI